MRPRARTSRPTRARCRWSRRSQSLFFRRKTCPKSRTSSSGAFSRRSPLRTARRPTPESRRPNPERANPESPIPNPEWDSLSRAEHTSTRGAGANPHTRRGKSESHQARLLPCTAVISMGSTRPDMYSPREIALAAGVPETDVVAALGGGPLLVSHAEAVKVGRVLAQYGTRPAWARAPQVEQAAAAVSLFSVFDGAAAAHRSAGVPLALSSTLHAGLIAFAAFLATFTLSSRAAALLPDDRPADPMRLVFVATPGPGGGGGGGGLREKAPAPKALREGRHTLSSPVPIRREPKLATPVPAPPEPKPEPLKSEPLPALIAPIVTAPADTRNRVGVLENAPAEKDSHGSGTGGGAGTGTGTGLGSGDGAGVGPGSGGGTGGGPYRPGSGIEPPRLLREGKADYTEEARRRGVSGDVVLEIVVRRDGSVGDVRVLRGLGGGLNERAMQAVRQWRFTPARRLGTPVDGIVEVAVEFRLR